MNIVSSDLCGASVEVGLGQDRAGHGLYGI